MGDIRQSGSRHFLPFRAKVGTLRGVTLLATDCSILSWFQLIILLILFLFEMIISNTSMRNIIETSHLKS